MVVKEEVKEPTPVDENIDGLSSLVSFYHENPELFIMTYCRIY
jgi:hypothetical protein